MTTTLTEFLLARIAEDEAAARECKEWSDCFACPTHERFDTKRVLAECEAKRRIVERHSGTHMPIGTAPFGYQSATSDVLRDLAAVYADHSDYREEWKP